MTRVCRCSEHVEHLFTAGQSSISTSSLGRQRRTLPFPLINPRDKPCSIIAVAEAAVVGWLPVEQPQQSPLNDDAGLFGFNPLAALVHCPASTRILRSSVKEYETECRRTYSDGTWGKGPWRTLVGSMSRDNASTRQPSVLNVQ